MRARGRSAAAWLALSVALGGCARAQAPPEIRIGAGCASCGMEIQDLRFACERPVGKGWRAYDSIECLIRDGGPVAALGAWLPDYDSRELHRADSVWVVQGSFPSPMGGGYASFRSRGAADSLASATAGSVARLAEHAAAGGAR